MPRGSIWLENDDRGGGRKTLENQHGHFPPETNEFPMLLQGSGVPPPSGRPPLLRFDNDEDADALETLRSWKAGMAGSWEVEKLGSLTRRDVVTVGRGW